MNDELKELIINKSAFPFYTDYWQQYFSRLTGEQCKEVIRIICQFALTANQEKSEDFGVDIVANTIITNLTRDAKKRGKRILASQNNGKLGGRPKIDKPKKPKKTQENLEEPIGLLIPDFIDAELWNDFISHRKKVKAELTERAAKLIIKELTNFEKKKKGNANISLENTIKSGKWTGVFEPKENNFDSSGKYDSYQHLLK